MSLCYRCEHRAKYLETGERPRFECGEVGKSKSSCYYYVPIMPIVLQRDKGDKRPVAAPWLFSARSHFVRMPENLKLDVKKYKDGYMMYWKLKM